MSGLDNRLLWSSGMPTFPWNQEWFDVRLTDGRVIQLHPLPKCWSYQWKDKEETYYTDEWTKENVKEWSQKETSQYIKCLNYKPQQEKESKQ